MLIWNILLGVLVLSVSYYLLKVAMTYFAWRRLSKQGVVFRTKHFSLWGDLISFNEWLFKNPLDPDMPAWSASFTEGVWPPLFGLRATGGVSTFI